LLDVAQDVTGDIHVVEKWYLRGRRGFWIGIISPLILVAVIVALDVAGAHHALIYVLGAIGIMVVCCWMAFAVIAATVVRRGRRAPPGPESN
jgi:hypothetical protein